MKQKLKRGKWRVRWDFGTNRYAKYLLRKKKELLRSLEGIPTEKPDVEKTKASQEKEMLKKTRDLEDVLYGVNFEIKKLEDKYGRPVHRKTRRSFDCRNDWQANYVEDLFKKAADYEAEGNPVPKKLQDEITELRDAPYRADYLEEVSFQLASVCAFQPSVVSNFDYSLFLSQADVNMGWLDSFEISANEIEKGALALCVDQETVSLKNKNYIFTGSFVSHTACDDYVKCLIRLADDKEIDGVITVGPWVKYIFLHKTGSNQKVLDSVRKLASKVKIYAIRSNTESADLIPKLKELGITFVSRIVDENNEFLPYHFSRISNKNQLSRYNDYSKPKNIFVYTTYVAFEARLRDDKLRYVIGSGSASYNTPSSRIWANAYSGQFINTLKYDTVGGHLLRFDKRGQVYPSSFYYNKKTKSIFCNGNTYSANKVEEGKLHVLASDVHAAHMDKATFSSFVNFLTTHSDRIETLCINGDFFDNNLLSHWDEKKVLNQIENKAKYKSFLHEIALAREILKQMLKPLKKGTKLIFKLGNHEINSLRNLTNRSLIHFLSNMLDLDNLLELSDLGFEIIGGKKPYKIQDISLYHGHEMTRPKALGNFTRKNVSGHWHRAKIDNYGVVLPTFQDTGDVDYMRYHMQDWSNGWGVITEDKNGFVESPELILMHSGKYNDFDGIVKASTKNLVKMPQKITLNYKLE